MKIWVVLDYVLPTDGANTLQVVKTVEALARQNADTTLWVPSTMHKEIRASEIFLYYGVNTPFSVRSVACPVGKLGLIRKEKWLFPKRLFLTNTERPDVLLTRAWPTALFACKAGIPTFYETYRHLVGKHVVTQKILQKLSAYSTFAGVIAHSESSAATLDGLRYRTEVNVIHNGWDQHAVEMTTESCVWPVPGGKRVLLYAGHVGRKKGVISIYELASHLPEFVFVVIGYRNEIEKRRLNKLARRYEVENVYALPWVLPAKVPGLLRRADALLLPLTDRPFRQGDTGLPLKLFEYLASGRAVIAPDIPAVYPLLEHNKNALLLSPDETKKSAQSIRNFMENESKMATIQRNQLETAAYFTWDLRAQRLLSLFGTC